MAASGGWRSRSLFAAIGLIGGLAGGLVGAGGGFLMVPLQVMWARTTQHQANATSLVATIPIAIAALPVYYFRHGGPAVDLHFAFFLVVGSVIGAYVGARYVSRIPERELKIVVAITMLIVGLKEIVFP